MGTNHLLEKGNSDTIASTYLAKMCRQRFVWVCKRICLCWWCQVSPRGKQLQQPSIVEKFATGPICKLHLIYREARASCMKHRCLCCTAPAAPASSLAGMLPPCSSGQNSLRRGNPVHKQEVRVYVTFSSLSSITLVTLVNAGLKPVTFP